MRRQFFFLLFGALVLFCATTTQAQAQATRTWVSGIGDDANACSRTAPCKTFAGAYSRTAAGGEIDVLDPGGYGTITISKSLTIDGGGGQVASILGTSGVTGVIVNAGANDRVTLRNLSINGVGQYAFPGGTGINFIAGLLLNVENCYIFGFINNGIDFEPNSRAFLKVTDSVIDSNGQGGGALGGIIAATAAAGGGFNRVLIDRTQVTNNGGTGLTIGQNTIATIRDSYVERNGIIGGGDYGILSTGGGAEANIEHTVISNNNSGGVHASSLGLARLSFSDILDNGGPGVTADPAAAVYTYGNNRNQGNSGGPGGFTGGVSPSYVPGPGRTLRN